MLKERYSYGWVTGVSFSLFWGGWLAVALREAELEVSRDFDF